MTTRILSDKVFALPAEALYQALLETGHVHSKSEFAKLAKISVGNVYNYLPSHRGTRRTGPFMATIETIRKWVEALKIATGLRIQITLPDDGGLYFDVDGVTASGQRLSPPVRYQVHADVLFSAPAPAPDPGPGPAAGADTAAG